jgi:DNA-binding GntR family transcriptional regulator
VTVKADDPRPAFVQVADELREDIQAGTLRAGQQLPSWRALGKRFGVTPSTVEKGINILRAEGLVEASHGRGTFVRDKDAEAESSAEYVAIMTEIRALADQVRATNERLAELEKLVGHPTQSPPSTD